MNRPARATCLQGTHYPGPSHATPDAPPNRDRQRAACNPRSQQARRGSVVRGPRKFYEQTIPNPADAPLCAVPKKRTGPGARSPAAPRLRCARFRKERTGPGAGHRTATNARSPTAPMLRCARFRKERTGPGASHRTATNARSRIAPRLRCARFRKKARRE